MNWLLNLFRRLPAPPHVAGREIPPPPTEHATPAPSPVQDLVTQLAQPAALDRPDWRVEHQVELLAFLRRDSGRQLMQMLRFNEEVLKSNAVDEQQKRIDHARGQAVGYRAALASLIILSAPPAPSEPEETADQPDRGADELRDQLSHN